MVEFTPLPAIVPLPHSMGDLLVERNPDGTETYTRIMFTSGKRQRITRDRAIRYATRYGGGMSPKLRSVLYPPTLTIHRLTRERMEQAIQLAERGGTENEAMALAKMEQATRDYYNAFARRWAA